MLPYGHHVLGPPSATLQVRTAREGAVASAGHDLVIEVHALGGDPRRRGPRHPALADGRRALARAALGAQRPELVDRSEPQRHPQVDRDEDPEGRADQLSLDDVVDSGSGIRSAAISRSVRRPARSPSICAPAPAEGRRQREAHPERLRDQAVLAMLGALKVRDSLEVVCKAQLSAERPAARTLRPCPPGRAGAGVRARAPAPAGTHRCSRPAPGARIRALPAPAPAALPAPAPAPAPVPALARTPTPPPAPAPARATAPGRASPHSRARTCARRPHRRLPRHQRPPQPRLSRHRRTGACGGTGARRDTSTGTGARAATCSAVALSAVHLPASIGAEADHVRGTRESTRGRSLPQSIR